MVPAWGCHLNLKTMNVESIRSYCIEKKGVTEGFPFDETTLVFKVMDKIFCLLSLEQARVSLKNDPEKNMELRAQYPAIIGGYHLNKKHWNTVDLDGSVPPQLLRELIDESYALVVKSLPKKKQAELNALSQ